MADFDDPFGDGPPAGPAWAPQFDGEAFATFRDKVLEDVRGRGFRCAEVDGVLAISRQDQETRCGLQNLSQMCAQNPRAAWGRIIADHFDRVLGVLDVGHDIEALAHDFEAIRGRLRPRLMSEETLRQAGIECVAEVLADELVAVAVFDLPDTTMTVRREYLEAWGRTAEEVLAVAAENLAAAEDLRTGRERFGIEGGGHIDCYGDDYYSASHLLLLERYLPPGLPFGALVAVPHRHALLVHALEDLSVIPSLTTMVQVARGMFEEGPGSICPHLYWWRRDAIVRLPIEIQDEKLVFAPPPDFLAVLEALEATPSSIS